MFKRFLIKKNIRFRTENRFKVLSLLLWNYILLYTWKLKKWTKGIKHPVIHLYTLCWNEEKMIPFFLQYYGRIVDKIVVYDNYSDDKTEKLLQCADNVSIIKYDTGGSINDLVYQQIKNTVWKKSRGKADYVIVNDMDEFLYHPQLSSFLSNSLNKKYSILETQGYEMYSQDYPVYDKQNDITTIIPNGLFSQKYSKSIIFDPHRIVDINYMPGAHEFYPEGIVYALKNSELKLLHYKNLGVQHLLERMQQYKPRLSDINKQESYGIEYNREKQTIIDEFNQNIIKAKPVI